MNDLKIIHTSNRNIWEINLDDTLTYTIVIYNITEDNLENLDIEINLPIETKYIENTCTLNGNHYNYNYNGKIYIKKIYPRENIIITLDIKIEDKEYPNEISSFTKINYTKKSSCSTTSYTEGSWNNPKAYIEQTTENKTELSVISQNLITPIIFRNIYINHEINKLNVSLGEILDFRFIIKNNSTLSIDEVFLENISNADIEIENNSLYINGLNIIDNPLKNNIYLGIINPKETVLISFKGKIKKVNNLNAISNKCKLNFFYKNDVYNRSARTIESNELILNLCPSISKSINLSKVINIPNYNPKVNQITDIFNYNIDVTSKNIVINPHSKGKTMFVSGHINGRITYNADYGIESYGENKMYILEYEISFKTDISIPQDFKEFINVIPVVQFIDASLLDSEKIYVNSILDIDLLED